MLSVAELEPYFQNFMAMFERHTGQPFTHGESLIDKVQFGWGVFDEDLDAGSPDSLLEDILNYSWDDDDGEPPVNATDDYVWHGAPWHDSEFDKWTDFCSEVRAHPETTLLFEAHIVEDFRMFSVELPGAHVLHRARLGCERDDDGKPRAYAGAAIGPPPAEKASAGRGNRQGEVVLYCADDASTAVAEIRPARGELVSVCTVRLRRPARILDLTTDYDFNPFTSENAKHEAEFYELMRGFAEEMSTPMQRSDDRDHYVPCQRFCEYIAANGYAGLRYPSALSEDGTNVLLFNAVVGEVRDSRLVEVRHVRVEFDDA